MRKVDVYGTLGPACQEQTVLEEMFRQGMTGMRLNLSHTGLKQCAGWLENFHQAAKAVGISPKLLIDLQGPELRIGTLEEVLLSEGEMCCLGKEGIPVPTILFPYFKVGQQLLLDDGKILLEVTEVGPEDKVQCGILRGGVLRSRKSIALPGVSVQLPTLTESDLANIALAKDYGVTGVMLPFVRNANDLRALRKALEDANAPEIQIFAKIENMEGVKQLSELLPYADEMVIARGDLGNSMPLWELPKVQYEIGNACKKVGKPYMVVTQMLASMEHAAVPTRAEVSDIFYAVLHGASSVMLTGETAAGEYPIEAIKYMCQTVRGALVC